MTRRFLIQGISYNRMRTRIQCLRSSIPTPPTLERLQELSSLIRGKVTETDKPTKDFHANHQKLQRARMASAMDQVDKQVSAFSGFVIILSLI